MSKSRMQKTIQVSKQQAPTPDRVLQLAKEHQLGQIRSCHRRRGRRFLIWFVPCVLIFAILSFIVGGYLTFFYNQGQYDGSWLQLCGMIMWSISFTLISLWGNIGGTYLLQNIKMNVYVTDRGLLCIDGKKLEVIYWNEIKALSWWRKQDISYLLLKNKPKFSGITYMDNTRELNAAIAKAVTECLLPEMLAQYENKGKVKFGSLSVTHDGITNWGKIGPQAWAKVILWDEIEDVRFERGKLGVKINDEWKDWSNGFFDMYILPNPTVCVALIRQILQQREQEKA